jgi:hypothetical protein
MASLTELKNAYLDAVTLAKDTEKARLGALDSYRTALVEEETRRLLVEQGIAIGDRVRAFHSPYFGRPEREMGLYYLLGVQVGGLNVLRDRDPDIGYDLANVTKDGLPSRSPRRIRYDLTRLEKIVVPDVSRETLEA